MRLALHRHILPTLGVGTAALAVVVTAVALAVAATRPPSLVWESIDVLPDPVRDGQVVIAAVARRAQNEGCTNGIQAEMRTPGASVVRLDPPVREAAADGTSIYTVDLPKATAPGSYQVRLRETFNCGGRPEAVESPWLTFGVP